MKANYLFLNMRDMIQTNGVFAPKNYDQNQPFFVKLKKEYGGLYANKTLILILPDLFIIQCGLNCKK